VDNVCHTLVGVAVAQAGFKSRTALATATGAIAANLPDIDVLAFATDMPAVAFRRGITHGLPAQVLLPIACAAVMWAIGRRRMRASGPPVHFGWLLALSYIGIFTHVFLDFLNTYGVRLLSPMSQRWFYGDAVFIVDVWLWLMLGAGAFFARKGSPRFAVASLACATIYIGGMLVSAKMARAIVEDAWITRSGQPARSLMVGPVPLSPLRKNIIVDAGEHYVEGTFNWLPARVSFDEEITPKHDQNPVAAAARRDPGIAGLLVWSRFPFWEIREVAGGTEVRVRDMRFKRLGAGSFTATTVVR
jgi:inner membrane protein